VQDLAGSARAYTRPMVEPQLTAAGLLADKE
jgi:hypothetical protein